MILEVYAVFDKQVGAYMQPFFMRTLGEAGRAFSEAVNDPSTGFFKHPGDYALCVVGVFDDATGKLTSVDGPPKVVREAVNCLRGVKLPLEEHIERLSTRDRFEQEAG